MSIRKGFALFTGFSIPALVPICLALFCFIVVAGFVQSAGRNNNRNAGVAELQAAVAVRASGCITCHAKISPSYVTDFGYGDAYFFGNPGASGGLGSFNGHIYGDFFGGEPNKTGWFTAEIAKEIIVPRAVFPFSLKSAAAKMEAIPEYTQPLQAASLAAYLQALENQKPHPAKVIEKNEVFIGAPDAVTLEARFGIVPGTGTEMKYIKNGSESPELEGIGLSPGKKYYLNKGEVQCDGDLFLRGSLFLDHVVLSTEQGCRIYTTGPIFVQGGIDYKGDDSETDRSNLQLVSSEAILLGIGDKSCDASDKQSPLSRRLISGYAISTFITRQSAKRSIAPQMLGKEIYAKAKEIDSLQDATCGEDGATFSRLLLNAPQIHSRYKGKFTGMVIAEIALFRQGQCTFEFDPVFKAVPVLSMLKESDFLQVQ